jgi:signal transduction histidine kinase
MGELIDGLLRLARVTRGELSREPVDVSALANRLLDQLQAAEPGRRVRRAVAPGLLAQGDERLLEVVFGNLLANAWKYTARAAEPAIHVEGRAGARMTVICVRDNGAGFDMRHAAKLFQPFQRLHREDEFPGLGIGLATVRRIMRRHGGDIEAAGTPGAGATFTLSFPVF